MKFIIHGAAKEVGRSCIECITGKNTRFLFDAGIKLSEEGTEFPARISDPKGIDAVFISHAHLDHTGYLPSLDHKGMKCPIFSTAATKSLTKLLLIDAFKIGQLKHEHLGYVREDITKTMGFMRRAKTDSKGSIKDVKFRYFNAGHIPGSASIVAEADGKKVLYTGDINTQDTRLLKRADTSYSKEDIDVMITEATYGNREHPDRKRTEKAFLDEIEETLERGGSPLIPVFAVGRAQEIMLILNKYDFGVPVYLDGMARKATRIILDSPRSSGNPSQLRSAYDNVKPVKGRIQRKSVEKKQAIYLTTSGMLTGGPVIDYLKHMADEPRHSVLLTGYQVRHTNGRNLLRNGRVFLDGAERRVRCNVRQFDFSAHSDKPRLKKLIKEVNPRKLVINHGDPDAVESMREWAEALDIETYAPEMGGKIVA
ncbi:MAG: MBL fold metallo-hydrolase [Candidatus Woesearchaeota archaeon]